MTMTESDGATPMATAAETGAAEREVAGARGRIFVHVWPNDAARFICLLVHGYGEHSGRYGHVAKRLVAAGGVVYAPDHQGHGRSDGERALIENGQDLTADCHTVVELAREEHPGLALVVVGHSMGGLIAARYAQSHLGEITALVLSGPAVGGNPAILALAEMDPIPEIPIDPEILSRDPETAETYAADPLVYHGPFLRPTLITLATAVEAVRDGPALGDLPTLWIHGEEDQLIPLDATRETMEVIRGPATEEKIYPGARHEIFNETNRDEVLGDVVAFLDRHV